MAGVGLKLAAAAGVFGAFLAVHDRGGITPTALATDVGFVRVAHLSPDTAPFDAYIVPAGSTTAAITLRNRSYGQISPYQALSPGDYTATLRGAGTGERGVVLLSQQFHVDSGKTYTLAVTGLRTQLSLRVVGDDVRPAGSGKAKVRVFNAATSLDPAQVTDELGTVLWPQVGFGTVSSYRDIAAGRHTVRAGSPGSAKPRTEQADTLAGNAVYSVLVLDGPNGPRLALQTDAAAPTTVPTGPVQTGFGGAAALLNSTAPFATAPFATAPFATAPFATAPFATGPFATGPFDAAALEPVTWFPGPVLSAVVPAGRVVPVELTIPRIGVRTRVTGLHLNRAGALVPPAGTGVAGWYGSVPGDPGPAVLAGHVDSRTGPAVFFRLHTLRPGDAVLVRRSDGRTLRYRVVAVERYAKDDFPTDRVYEVRPDSELRLITCGGEFDAEQRSYRDDIVVTARPAAA